ncbi:MAG: PHP domain-containing protein [Oscillospiraceae bacterium]
MISTDLHMHSCLSPCGDDEMTPFDLVGMAKLCGMDLIALTDHNSVKNCPAAAAAAEEYGIGFIPGAEVTTAEDIHCVCLFPGLDSAMSFDSRLYESIPYIPNRREIFGNQIIMHPDGKTDEEAKLLITGCGFSIIDLPQIVGEYGGICYPAHVDRDANGLFAVLGSWPEELKVKAAEIRHKIPDGLPQGLKIIKASDAHRMSDIPEGGFPLPLESPDFCSLAKYICS